MNNKIPVQFQDLPEYVQDILLSDESIMANKKIIKGFGLSDEQIDILFDVLRKIVFKQIVLSQLLESLKPLDFDETKTKKIAVEILKRRILLLSDYLKINTLSYIKEWGGDIPADELSVLVKTESQGKINADNIVKQIIKETGLELKDDVLKNRFKNIVLSFVRNVRSSTETAIVLKRPFKIGGIGLEQEMTDKIMDVLQKEDQRAQTVSVSKEKIINAEKVKALIKAPAKELLEVETKMPKIITEAVKIKEPLTPKIQKANIKKEEITEDIEESIKKFQPKLEKLSIKEKPKIKIEDVSMAEIPKAKVALDTESPVFSKTSKRFDKTMVESITNQPKIYGPSDELRSISLIDWRRWGASQEAVAKILEKINLLAEDSLVKKAEGIKAWKESEINKLYLNIGEESINNGKSIEEMINERQEEGRKTLTQEEFNAVVELNQKLRF